MQKNAYEIEHYRNELALQGKLRELKLLYSPKYAEIPDLNSAQFWNKKLYARTALRDQDGMTRDRVSIAADFLQQNGLVANRILDIGMGDGWVEEILEKRELTLYGNDISTRAIHNAKKRFKGEFSVQSLYNVSYSDLAFDAIFLLEVLEHVPPSKTFKVLESIRKLLLPNGYFILSVPTNEGLETMPDNPSGHVRMYTVPLIRAELELSGFEILQQTTLYAFKNYYQVKKILTHIFKDRWKPNNIIIKAQKR